MEALFGRGATEALDVEVWETAARGCALRVAARVLEGKLNARGLTVGSKVIEAGYKTAIATSVQGCIGPSLELMPSLPDAATT